MKKCAVLLMVLFSGKLYAQELFVFTEPASNMATKSIGLRLNNYFNKYNVSGYSNYYLIPEIMWGVSRKVMVHGDLFFSKSSRNFSTEGGSIYAKYRFLSNDEVHTHFRMAAYGRISYNNSPVRQPAINFYGYNSGYETGVIATQLINKVALSATSSFLHAFDNGKEKFLPGQNRNAINYSLSIGKLMLPKEYTSYRQTNLNLMLEFLGQTNLASGASYLDMAPAIQFIFDSRVRVDLSYLYTVVNKLQRTATSGIFVRLEYNFFNVY